MNMAEADGLSTALDSVQINGTESADSEMDEYEREWGFPLEELYKLASAFYKEKEGKAIHLTYKDKLRLVAYTKQVTYGKYRTDVSPEVGFLDVVGNDRRQAWQALGDMSRDSAMAEFMKQLNVLCPLFKPYIQAHKTEKEDQERRREKEEEKQREEDERKRLVEEAQVRQEQEKQRQQQQEVQIRAALNQQTARQFRQYAEQQYPEDKAQQDTLINQLQEQHYQQYMQQVYQQQLLHQQQQYQQLQAMAASTQRKQSSDSADLTNQQLNQDSIPQQLPTADAVMDGHMNADGLMNTVENNHDADEDDEDTDEQNDLPPIAAASMWNRKDIKEFKESIKKDPDSVIKVGSGETVTVRVPTHEDGTCLFWEFATDSYDLGFGVYFEWTIAPSNAVSVHVSESSDEEDLEEEDGETKGDIEKGSKKDNRPPTDEIIPVYRRDCHEEVYCGSHMYPGRGVYLLKFDNSYSLWRSKYLYYRVYYTR